MVVPYWRSGSTAFEEITMTVRVSLAQGLGCCVGQRMYYGGQWLKITAKFPITEAGRVVAFNIILVK